MYRERCSCVIAPLIRLPWITAWKRTLSRGIKYGNNLLAQDVPKLQIARSVPGDRAGFAGPNIPGDAGVIQTVVTTPWSSQQGDSGVFLCHTFVLERGKGLRTAFNKGTQMFVFIAPPELIKILTFKKKKRKKLPAGMRSGLKKKKLQMG